MEVPFHIEPICSSGVPYEKDVQLASRAIHLLSNEVDIMTMKLK